MSKSLHLDSADLVALGRLTTSAVSGVTDIVEDVHAQVACPSAGLPQRSTREFQTGTPALIYSGIRAVAGIVDSGLAVAKQVPASKPRRLSPGREVLMAALNGVFGDYLVRTNNPLAIFMSVRHRGRSLEIKRHALKAVFSEGTGKVLLLAHGLCMNDLQWKRRRHDHGAALCRDLAYTPVYLHYNSGLHVSENGRFLASLLETLLEQWPVPVNELVIIGHSMGGLVARSACYYGAEAGHHWPRHLRRLVFLGTPHHGAPLERLVNFVDTALKISPYSAPFARLGKIRSGGVTDMRYGNLLDDDWKGRDRFVPAADVRRPLRLPAGVDSYALAACTQKATGECDLELFGDGLVPVNSALGRHRDPAMNLGLSEAHEWIGHGMNHWDLLNRRAAYDRIRRWFGSH